MSAHILMVDDEPDAEELFRQNFRREIRKGALRFDFARSGREALDLLAFEDPPRVLLVLSDINMPGMTGVELLDEIRRRWPSIKIFMISAYGDDSTERAVLEKGAEQFFTKPVDFMQLKEQLTTLVEATG